MESFSEEQLKNLMTEHNLNWRKSRDFIAKWASALLTYGTDAVEFLKGTVYTKGKINFGGAEYPAQFKSGGNNDLRRKLMAEQKPYVAAKTNLEDYGIRLDFAKCFLCQNVVQGYDAVDNPTIDNVIEAFGEFFIMPNRYPAFAGHSLWVPVNHDDTKERVIPADGVLAPEKGKTRGAILTTYELKNFIDATRKNNLGAIRNHVLDAMSIPGHDHFHLMPDDTPNFAMLNYLMKEKDKQYMKGVFTLKNTPFSTLAITSDTKGDYPDFISYILCKMELDNQVFVLSYRDGIMLVSPRKNINDHKRIQVGGGIHLHFPDKPDADYLAKADHHIVKRGEYDWKKYIE
ncbi:hypothetical protein JW756_02810 [Candidatus Woesearchaeota archaeon]|nr:hypothetical protein [Candidatus Woesearchaeota archaeon]